MDRGGPLNEEMVPLVYDELRKIAARKLRDERTESYLERHRAGA